MDLIKITDLTNQLGLSSRSLRYYEQVGLIKSVRSDTEKYRYYNSQNIERLKQIMVLRKMQIPIKDILRIYESEDMSTVVDAFVSRIHAIDDEVNALSELRSVVNEFLQAMIENGVTKISALPILYEEMEKRVDALEERKVISYSELSDLSERLAKPLETSIACLPAMRMISSQLKENPNLSDADGFRHWAQVNDIWPDESGSHEIFEFQISTGDVVIMKVSDDFINNSQYLDYAFAGGLFAAANIYLDEDLGERFRSLLTGFDNNKYYQIDYRHDGTLRHPALLKKLISPDDQRELVSLLVPVKKRTADPALYEKPQEIVPESISIEEIEIQNPSLWTVDVPMDKLIPINYPHYQITEQGEAEYIAWISTRVLSTDVAVKLPFRVDVEFRIRKENLQFAWGTDEGSVRLYHGNDLNHLFGINMETNPDERLSQEAICFHQPIFRNYFKYQKRGGINRNEYNRLTWIVGQTHLVVFINNEIRYCGVNFPYMSVDLRNQEALPILIGSNGQSKMFFKSIRVSQLAQIQKSKIKKGELIMITRQSNNMIPNIHRFIISEHGENYHFNGCARYVMESLGEYTADSDLMTEEIYNGKEVAADFGYWFFAGLTGDILAQVYSYREYMGEAATACIFNREGGSYFEKVFEKCGYASTFVSAKQLCANKEMYLQTLMAYIDKGIPVIAITHLGPPWGIYVGYEEFGKTLFFLSGDKSEPERVPVEQIIGDEAVSYSSHTHQGEAESHAANGWIFVGEKKYTVDLAQAYRDIIFNMPDLLTIKTDEYCFGAEAFRAWADSIENGKFDDVKPEEFDSWGDHVSNICNMATNGSCVHNFLKRAQGLNPHMTFLDDINRLYERTARIWNNDNGEDLEALGGGFNVTLEELQNKERRSKIAAKIREAADCMDEVVQIINENSLQ